MDKVEVRKKVNATTVRDYQKLSEQIKRHANESINSAIKHQSDTKNFYNSREFVEVHRDLSKLTGGLLFMAKNDKNSDVVFKLMALIHGYMYSNYYSTRFTNSNYRNSVDAFGRLSLSYVLGNAGAVPLREKQLVNLMDNVDEIEKISRLAISLIHESSIKEEDEAFTLSYIDGVEKVLSEIRGGKKFIHAVKYNPTSNKAYDYGYLSAVAAANLVRESECYIM